jgi:hypothetical protein
LLFFFFFFNISGLSLNARLPEIEVLVHLEIFDMNLMRDDLDYGVKGITALFDKLLRRRAKYPLDVVVANWQSFKIVWKDFVKPTSGTDATLKEILANPAFAVFPALRSLCRALKTLTFCTTPLEGGWSVMKYVYKASTNSMLDETKRNLLFLLLNGPLELPEEDSEVLGGFLISSLYVCVCVDAYMCVCISYVFSFRIFFAFSFLFAQTGGSLSNSANTVTICPSSGSIRGGRCRKTVAHSLKTPLRRLQNRSVSQRN